MPATYDELAARAQASADKAYTTSYTPAYEAEYRARMQKRYGEEIPAAQAMREAAQSGDMSAQQGLDLGQNMQGQAAASVGSPLAARAAQYAGGAGALQASQQAAQIGQRALENAQSEELDARMRQVTYGQQLQQEELRRKAQQDAAIRARIQSEMAKQFAEDERGRRFGEAVLGAGQSLIGGFAGAASNALTKGVKE